MQLSGTVALGMLYLAAVNTLEYYPNGFTPTCVNGATGCNGGPPPPPVSPASPTPTSSGAPTPTPSVSPSSAPLDVQPVLIAYSMSSASLCNASNVIDKVLSPTTGFGLALRSSFAVSLGYNATSTFIDGVIVCNGTEVLVARDDPINSIDPANATAVAQLVGGGSRRLSSSTSSSSSFRRLSNTVGSLQLSMDGQTNVIELGVDVPIAVAGPLAGFLQATLSGANASVVAGYASSLAAALSDPPLLAQASRCRLSSQRRSRPSQTPAAAASSATRWRRLSQLHPSSLFQGCSPPSAFPTRPM